MKSIKPMFIIVLLLFIVVLSGCDKQETFSAEESGLDGHLKIHYRFDSREQCEFEYSDLKNKYNSMLQVSNTELSDCQKQLVNKTNFIENVIQWNKTLSEKTGGLTYKDLSKMARNQIYGVISAIIALGFFIFSLFTPEKQMNKIFSVILIAILLALVIFIGNFVYFRYFLNLF